MEIRLPEVKCADTFVPHLIPYEAVEFNVGIWIAAKGEHTQNIFVIKCESYTKGMHTIENHVLTQSIKPIINNDFCKVGGKVAIFSIQQIWKISLWGNEAVNTIASRSVILNFIVKRTTHLAIAVMTTF